MNTIENTSQKLNNAPRPGTKTCCVRHNLSTTKTLLVRVEVPLESPFPLLNWLKKQKNDTKIYWSSRKGDLEVAAVGIVDSLDTTNTSSLEQAVSTIESRLKNASPQTRYYGGQCFDPGNIDLSVWGGFGPYRFIVPEYEVVRKNGMYTLARNSWADADVNIERLRQELREFIDRQLLYKESPGETDGQEQINGQISRQDTPCKSEWLSLARQVVNAIQDGQFEKIVLAHKADLVSAKPFSPIALLERIIELSSQTYTFLYQFPDSGVFLGASPECLFTKDSQDIYSEAIAGTRAISDDQAANSQLQKELQQSAKEQQEHDYVSDNIHAALQTLCHRVGCAESREILRTASVQHLYTRFNGKLSDRTSICHILNTLHPTAAVNGTPPHKAIARIRSLEPFSRGWYAGAVGWIMADRAEFAVGIRSALVRQNGEVSVYSGAGLVDGSDPEQEWNEVELKKQLILQAVQETVC